MLCVFGSHGFSKAAHRIKVKFLTKLKRVWCLLICKQIRAISLIFWCHWHFLLWIGLLWEQTPEWLISWMPCNNINIPRLMSWNWRMRWSYLKLSNFIISICFLNILRSPRLILYSILLLRLLSRSFTILHGSLVIALAITFDGFHLNWNKGGSPDRSSLICAMTFLSDGFAPR